MRENDNDFKNWSYEAQIIIFEVRPVHRFAVKNWSKLDKNRARMKVQRAHGNLKQGSQKKDPRGMYDERIQQTTFKRKGKGLHIVENKREIFMPKRLKKIIYF